MHNLVLTSVFVFDLIIINDLNVTSMLNFQTKLKYTRSELYNLFLV